MMDTTRTPDQYRPSRPSTEQIGRVAAVTGATATVELTARGFGNDNPTVGKFMGLTPPKTFIIGVVTEVGEEQVSASGAAPGFRKIARLDLIGELSGAGRRQRGATEYPNTGDAASLLTERELRLVYGAADADRAHVGDLQQSPNIGVHIDIDHLVSRHFAILGATGVGKSSGVAIILRGPTCASSWSIRTTNTAAASATRRRC